MRAAQEISTDLLTTSMNPVTRNSVYTCQNLTVDGCLHLSQHESYGAHTLGKVKDGFAAFGGVFHFCSGRRCSAGWHRTAL